MQKRPISAPYDRMPLEAEVQRHVRTQICVALGCEPAVYPGSLPTKLRRHHLYSKNLLRKYCTQRPEGTQVLLYHGKEGLFWCGTDGEIHSLHLDHMPSPTCETVADGWWVASERVFYITDAPFVRGRSVVKEDILQRLEVFRNEWLSQYKPGARDLFGVKIQRYVQSPDMQVLRRGHSMLFVEPHTQYICGHSAGLIEWSEPASIYALFRVRSEMRAGMHCVSLWLRTAGTDREVCYCDLSHMATHKPPAWTDGAVVKCRYDTEEWVFSAISNTWKKGVWRPFELAPPLTKPMYDKDAWHFATATREHITIDDVLGALVPQQEMDEIEWEEVNS